VTQRKSPKEEHKVKTLLKHYRAVRDWEAKNHNTSHNKLLCPSVHSQDKHKIKVVYEQNSRLTQ